MKSRPKFKYVNNLIRILKNRLENRLIENRIENLVETFSKFLEFKNNSCRFEGLEINEIVQFKILKNRI